MGMPIGHKELRRREIATTKWAAQLGRPATLADIIAFKDCTYYVATVTDNGQYFYMDGHPAVDPSEEGVPCKVP
jgi:hypothetical protein